MIESLGKEIGNIKVPPFKLKGKIDSEIWIVTEDFTGECYFEVNTLNTNLIVIEL